MKLLYPALVFAALTATTVMAINIPPGHELLKQEGNYYTVRNKTTNEINRYYIEGEPVTNGWQTETLDDSVIFQQVYYLDAFLFYKIFVHDFNGNGKPEFFAADMGEGIRTRFFENQGDFNFIEVHRIEEPMSTKGFGDVDNDGLYEILTQATDTIRLIEQNRLSGYPSELVWLDTSLGGPYVSYARIGDIDRDGMKDVTFITPNYPRAIEVFENTGNNTFDHKQIIWQSGGLADYAYNDFDNDGLNEIVSDGPTPTEIKILENVGNDSFAPVWQTGFGCPNIYLHEVIGDNNGNGYGEWVSCGRDFSRSGFFFKVFEATGDNQYQVAYYDSLPGDCWEAGGLAHGDIDNDGRNEFIVSANSNIGLYKYDPVSGWHKIWLCDDGGFATTYPFLLDVDNDGECEIVLSGELLRVRIYDRQLGGIESDANGIKDEGLILYPNPTNNTLKISLSKSMPIRCLDIFDLNGRLVKNINLKDMNSVNWDLRDNRGKEMASGIYFIVYDVSGVQTVRRATILR